MRLFSFLKNLIGYRKRGRSIKDSAYRKFQCYADPLYFPWLCDQEFLLIDQRYGAADPDNMFRDGRYIQYTLAQHAAQLKVGDFIECGVFKGKSLDIFASVLDNFKHLKKELIGIDSFEGVSMPNEKDIDVRTGTNFFEKGMIKGFDKNTIQEKLNHHQCKITLLKGWIPDIFQDLKEKKFAFVHIDVDLYQPTLDSLFFIYDRVVDSGIILFDDYGFPMCKGAKEAVDQFLRDKKEVLIPIPSGQAFIIKQNE